MKRARGEVAEDGDSSDDEIDAMDIDAVPTPEPTGVLRMLRSDASILSLKKCQDVAWDLVFEQRGDCLREAANALGRVMYEILASDDEEDIGMLISALFELEYTLKKKHKGAFAYLRAVLKRHTDAIRSAARLRWKTLRKSKGKRILSPFGSDTMATMERGTPNFDISQWTTKQKEDTRLILRDYFLQSRKDFPAMEHFHVWMAMRVIDGLTMYEVCHMLHGLLRIDALLANNMKKPIRAYVTNRDTPLPDGFLVELLTTLTPPPQTDPDKADTANYTTDQTDLLTTYGIAMNNSLFQAPSIARVRMVRDSIDNMIEKRFAPGQTLFHYQRDVLQRMLLMELGRDGREKKGLVINLAPGLGKTRIALCLVHLNKLTPANPGSTLPLTCVLVPPQGMDAWLTENVLLFRREARLRLVTYQRGDRDFSLGETIKQKGDIFLVPFTVLTASQKQKDKISNIDIMKGNPYQRLIVDEVQGMPDVSDVPEKSTFYKSFFAKDNFGVDKIKLRWGLSGTLLARGYTSLKTALVTIGALAYPLESPKDINFNAYMKDRVISMLYGKDTVEMKLPNTTFELVTLNEDALRLASILVKLRKAVINLKGYNKNDILRQMAHFVTTKQVPADYDKLETGLRDKFKALLENYHGTVALLDEDAEGKVAKAGDLLKIVDDFKASPGNGALLDAVREKIAKLHTDYPDDKIIVFARKEALKDINAFLQADPEGRFEDFTPSASKAVVIYDDVTKTPLTLNQFQYDPHTFCMLTTLTVSGMSFNMQYANHVIFMEYPYRLSEWYQGRGRVERIGQDKVVTETIYHVPALEKVFVTVKGRQNEEKKKTLAEEQPLVHRPGLEPYEEEEEEEEEEDNPGIDGFPVNDDGPSGNTRVDTVPKPAKDLATMQGWSGAEGGNVKVNTVKPNDESGSDNKATQEARTEENKIIKRIKTSLRIADRKRRRLNLNVDPNDI